MSDFDLLGVSPNATADELKAARRKFVKELHPDINPNGGERLAELNAAYDRVMAGKPDMGSSGKARSKSSTRRNDAEFWQAAEKRAEEARAARQRNSQRHRDPEAGHSWEQQREDEEKKREEKARAKAAAEAAEKEKKREEFEAKYAEARKSELRKLKAARASFSSDRSNEYAANAAKAVASGSLDYADVLSDYMKLRQEIIKEEKATLPQFEGRIWSPDKNPGARSDPLFYRKIYLEGLTRGDLIRRSSWGIIESVARADIHAISKGAISDPGKADQLLMAASLAAEFDKVFEKTVVSEVAHDLRKSPEDRLKAVMAQRNDVSQDEAIELSGWDLERAEGSAWYSSNFHSFAGYYRRSAVISSSASLAKEELDLIKKGALDQRELTDFSETCDGVVKKSSNRNDSLAEDYAGRGFLMKGVGAIGGLGALNSEAQTLYDSPFDPANDEINKKIGASSFASALTKDQARRHQEGLDGLNQYRNELVDRGSRRIVDCISSRKNGDYVAARMVRASLEKVAKSIVGEDEGKANSVALLLADFPEDLRVQPTASQLRKVSEGFRGMAKGHNKSGQMNLLALDIASNGIDALQQAEVDRRAKDESASEKVKSELSSYRKSAIKSPNFSSLVGYTKVARSLAAELRGIVEITVGGVSPAKDKARAAQVGRDLTSAIRDGDLTSEVSGICHKALEFGLVRNSDVAKRLVQKSVVIDYYLEREKGYTAEALSSMKRKAKSGDNPQEILLNNNRRVLDMLIDPKSTEGIATRRAFDKSFAVPGMEARKSEAKRLFDIAAKETRFSTGMVRGIAQAGVKFGDDMTRDEKLVSAAMAYEAKPRGKSSGLDMRA